MARYRVVKSDYGDYLVQIRRWWWPFWVSYGYGRHFSVERAKEWTRECHRHDTFVEYFSVDEEKGS